MAVSPPRPFLLLLVAAAAVFSSSAVSATSAKPQPVCPRSNLAAAVAGDGGSWCPRWIEPSPAPQVNGEIIDRLLTNGQKNSFYSVLFYASWCPFSPNVRPIFDSLASMFPQVQHFVVEEAAVMPSILSRYGVHSFPSIILMNGTSMFRFRGSKSKDLPSLVRFYKKSTGLNPMNYLVVDDTNNLGKMRLTRLPSGSLKELMSKEPYLAFSLFFIFLKALFWLFPLMFSHIKSFWLSHGPHLNLGFLNGSSHMLERVLHGIDIKKLWSKFRLFNKTRNFQKGANNARAWASSLASVSLGESSSRITNLD